MAKVFKISPSFPTLVLVIVFGVLATAYSVTTPPWESPDEVGHFSYVAHLLTSRTLPMQQLGQLGEAHQPPLYYAIAALAASPADASDSTGAFRPNPRFMWAGNGGNEINAGVHGSSGTFPFEGQALALQLSRLVSVLMGMGTVALTIAIGGEVFPKRRLIALLAGALVAFNPQFLFISGAVNNDNLLILAATGAIWQTLRAMKRPAEWRQWMYVGLWVGTSILAKLSGFAVGAMVAAALLATAVRWRSFGLLLRGALAVFIPVAFISGWWFVWNQVQYGDPLGWAMYEKVFAVNLRSAPLQSSDIQSFFSTQFRSSWGIFGWMNVLAPAWFFNVAGVMSVASVLGFVIFAARGGLGKLASAETMTIGFLGVTVLVQEAYMLEVITRCNASCYQGRYVFPIIGPAMILASLGLVNLMPRRIASFLAGGLALSLVGMAVYIPLQVIEPAYRTVPIPKWSLWLVPNQTEFIFGDILGLRGYQLSKDADGSRVRLTLYWQAIRQPDFDYSVFAHLIDESGQIVAQDDHAPGQNRGYPPKSWLPGDIVTDEHVISMPSESIFDGYRFRVGLYNWSTGKTLPARTIDSPLGDFVILDGIGSN